MKNILSLVLSIIIIFAFCTAASAGIIYGDFDKNGVYDSADLIFACQLDAGIIASSDNLLIDVDDSGAFDSADLILMCQYDAGIITVWPGELR